MSRLGKEDEYFLAHEHALRVKFRAELEAKAKTAAEQLKVAAHVGVGDEQLARRIHALGFEGETARVLHLMPLVEVAWADGSLSASERKVILQAAQAHGIEPHSQGGVFLASMLEERPSDTVLEQILEVLKDLLHARQMRVHGVLDACVDVAAASGGFLGFRDKISNEERALIEQIAATFGDDAKEHIAQRLA